MLNEEGNKGILGEKRRLDDIDAEQRDLVPKLLKITHAAPSKSSQPGEEEEEARDASVSRKEDEWELDANGSISLSFIKSSEDFASRAVCTGCTKKRFAIALAYLGTRYKGLQINPGVVTVESLLERALYLAGGLEEHNFGELRKLGWSRSGRTDKGVHAAANCCSMKLSVEPGKEEEFMHKVNSYLPSDLRIVAMTKTLKTFNAKEHCSSRRYQYLIPTYALVSREASNAIMNELISGSSDSETSSSTTHPRYLSPSAEVSLRSKLASHRMTEEDLIRFRSLLSRFKGTHSYHNFTSDISGDDKTAKRYILSMECSEPFVSGSAGSDGVEWVCITIHGQSFLLNQIRKMIGLAVEVFRGDKAESAFEKCFVPSEKLSISMVPGLGLYLMELIFERYNLKAGYELEKWQKAQQKWEREASQGATVPQIEGPGSLIQWSSDEATSARVEAFKSQVIWPHIFEEERDRLVFVKYLDHLRTQPLRPSRAQLL